MQILSEGGLPVSSIVWQSSAGAWALTAVCKLTFRLEPGVAGLASQQEPVNEEDDHWNDDVARSLVAPSDLAPFKPRADVVIVGHAFAPEGRPVRSLVVRVCAGEVDKSIEVFCDRAFEPDGGLREGSPFVKMPLRYERASGGHGLWNPVGLPFDAAPDAYGRVPIANLQPLGTFVRWKGDTFATVGLGPIAPHWPGRTEKLHRHARGWSHRDWNARPLPADFDVSYFNVAPADQQTDTIHPNERLVLENLHRDHARLVTSLPGLAPRAVVERASGYREQMALVADTLWIDTDRAICTVTWRGRIGLVHAAERGTVRLWAEGVDLRERAGGDLRERAEGGDLRERVAGVDVRERASRAESARAAGVGAEPAAAVVGVPPAAEPFEPDATATLAPGLESASRAALPFDASPWRVSPLAAPGSRASGGGRGGAGDAGGVGSSGGAASGAEEAAATMFLFPAAANTADTLPFARAPEPVVPAVAAPRGAVPAATVAPVGAALVGAAPAAELDRTENAPLVPLGTPAAASWEALRPAEPLSEEDARGRSSREPSAPEPAVPPPMIGPLAHVGMRLSPAEAEPEAKEAPAPEAAAPPPAPPKSPAAPPAEPELDLETYTLERCARIAVSVACRPADTAKILEEHELAEGTWGRVKNHWLEAIRKELGKGRPALMKRYDAAYVAQVEAERGPIGVAEYAQLSVAAERGNVGEAVAEMKLPPGAPMRIERVWMERMALDAAFGAKVRAAVEEARAV